MRHSLFAGALLLLASSLSLPLAIADGTVALGNNVLHSISVLTPLRPTNPAQAISIAVGLQGGDPSGEAAYLAAEDDRSSSLLGHPPSTGAWTRVSRLPRTCGRSTTSRRTTRAKASRWRSSVGAPPTTRSRTSACSRRNAACRPSR